MAKSSRIKKPERSAGISRSRRKDSRVEVTGKGGDRKCGELWAGVYMGT